MKKLILSLIILASCLLSFASPSPVLAQSGCIPVAASIQLGPLNDPNAEKAILGNGQWDCNDEVTFTGKLAARSKEVLNWVLRDKNYQWAYLNSGQGPTPFDTLWIFIRNVVYAILGLFILAAAFLMIITRGRSITVRRFVIRFIFVAVFVWFSFSIVRTIYFLGDIVQGFFIQVTDQQDQKTRPISDKDLFNISFDYKDFQGYRRIGPEFNEAAVTSLILIKVTAATYYTMFIILIIRKIILWFFILVSPVFPLLLFFKPVRNTAKIWVGEFFRWVLYAPLFMIFLRGLVEVWRFTKGPTPAGIPLGFKLDDVTKIDKILYPTSINITLGGPSQILAGNSNVNLTDTFVLYLVALIMLWMVIIMPWILLRIFLDYFNGFPAGDSNLLKFMAKNAGPLGPLANRYLRSPLGPAPVGTPPQGPPPGTAGLAKSLPMTRFKHTPVAEIQQNLAQAQAENAIGALNQTAQGVLQQVGQSQQQSASSLGQMFNMGSLKVPNLQTQEITADLLNLTNLNIPTMGDIAKYEAAMMSSSSSHSRQELGRMSEMLSRLSGTSQIASPVEKEHFSRVRERLITESNKGNPVAKSMVSAATGGAGPGGGAAIPESNEVQQVNLDDYEEVKKTWQENYRNLEAPNSPSGGPQKKSAWLKSEVAQIPKVIDLLLSGDPAKQEEGKRMVSKILPFLLLGGFSKAEIIAYLKAKLEAAKAVLNEVLEVEKKEEEEDSKVGVKQEGHAQAQATMHAEAEIPTNPEVTDQAQKPQS